MKRILFFIVPVVVFTVNTAFIINSGGITGRTGSPGETTCSACHGGGGGTTGISITSSPSFTGSMFLPGQTYTISITVSNSLFSKFGFNAEILNPSNTNAGNITSGLTGVQVVATSKKNVTQTTPKTGAGSAVFQFVWVAPLTGTATIYVAGNAVDGAGGTGADTPGSGSFVLTADLSPGINESSITSVSGFVIYPNPVKSEFRIKYNLLENGYVKAALHNLQGQEIMEIVNEKQAEGSRVIKVELPEDLAKGVYFVKLSVNEKHEIKRLIITQ